jgi:16S rRNA (adenine1518-N6/adenine1519-N6)-dimethyltransferase
MGLKNRVDPKRSLGQNFFANESLAKKITEIVLKSKPIHITEIGPGKGAFTKAFYDTTVEITLVEKDFHLAKILEKFFPNANIHNIDFLNFQLKNQNTTYFGSLPFNVSDEIIEKILKSDTFNSPSFFIIQKEVAAKYLNRRNNALGLITSIYAECEVLFDIKAGNFNPKPNVDASFIKFIPHNKCINIDKSKLERLITLSFKQPRKTLKNNLKPYRYKIPEELQFKRAQELTLDVYISILKAN